MIYRFTVPYAWHGKHLWLLEMDPLQAASRIPKLAELAMRNAILAAIDRRRMTPRGIVDDALVRFERSVGKEAPGGIRPALLFAERDRVVRELRVFIDGRLASRLAALRARDVVALGRAAAPFDAVVRSARGQCFGVMFRRLPAGDRRLDEIRHLTTLSGVEGGARTQLCGVLAYDFATGVARLLLRDAGAQRVNRHLRAS